LPRCGAQLAFDYGQDGHPGVRRAPDVSASRRAKSPCCAHKAVRPLIMQRRMTQTSNRSNRRVARWAHPGASDVELLNPKSVMAGHSCGVRLPSSRESFNEGSAIEVCVIVGDECPTPVSLGA
jgi:hypothetical protein